MAAERIPVEYRFWSRVDRNGPINTWKPELGPCWLWLGSRRRDGGYGQIHVSYNAADRSRVVKFAHVYSYELMVGPIPVGLELDHLCRTIMCVNPTHLEPVTSDENKHRAKAFRLATQLTCSRGHPWKGNTVPTSDGSRVCRECVRENQAEYRVRQWLAGA